MKLYSDSHLLDCSKLFLSQAKQVLDSIHFEPIKKEYYIPTSSIDILYSYAQVLLLSYLIEYLDIVNKIRLSYFL